MANGLNEYDFGARQYYSAVPGFTRIDPLCEIHYELSPYLFCGNNPVNLVDPTGMKWENKDDAEELYAIIRTRINETIFQIFLQSQNIQDNIEIWNSGQLKEERSKLEGYHANLSILSQALTDIKILDKDRHTYVLDKNDYDDGHHVMRSKDGKVHIQTSSDALTGHEMTHIRQSLVEGSLRFKNNMLLYANAELADMANFEIEAYKVQHAIDPSSMPIPVNDANGIDSFYIEKIKYPGTNVSVYRWIKEYNRKRKHFDSK